MSKSSKRFFVSHSSLDEEIVSLFVDDILVKGLRISDDEIYCSSMQGLGNLSGDNFVNEIKKALHPAEISFLMISENYKNSEICLNEMGASWISGCHVIPILIEPVSFSSIGPLNILKHYEKILSDNSMYNIRKTIKEKCSINPTGDGRWKSIVEKYVKAAKNVKIQFPLSDSVPTEKYEKVCEEKDGLQNEIKEMTEELDEKNDYIKRLEDKKDKEDVKVAKKESGLTTFEDDLEKKAKEVKECLNPFDKVVSRILLCNHHGLDHPNIDGYMDDIREAQRKKYITEDFESGTKKANRELEDAINEVESLAESEDFCAWYKEEYDEDFDPSDEEFWDDFYFN